MYFFGNGDITFFFFSLFPFFLMLFLSLHLSKNAWIKIILILE